MLRKVEVITEQGALLALPLDDFSGGYLVTSIEGLDPVKAVIVSSSFAQLDGEQYQASRREKRNPVINLDIKSNYGRNTVSDLRNKLYKFFMPKSSVTLRFYLDGGLIVDLAARVESCVSPLFTKDPNATISLLCFNPDFYAIDPVIVTGNTTSGTDVIPIDYKGSVETGILFHMDVNRSIPDFMMYHSPADGSIRQLEFISNLVAGDVLEISTVPGAKRATLTRAGSTTSILYGVSPSSDWITLFPGENTFRVVAEGAAIPYTIEYITKYGGL